MRADRKQTHKQTDRQTNRQISQCTLITILYTLSGDEVLTAHPSRARLLTIISVHNHSLQLKKVSLRTFSSGLSSECQKYGIVYERVGGAKRQEIICSGSMRTRAVYLSESNLIVVETFGGAKAGDDYVTDDVTTAQHRMSRFLLKYQGISGAELGLRS